LKITNNYENESYDYPSNVQENLSEFGKNIHYFYICYILVRHNCPVTLLGIPHISAPKTFVHLV
jgi:hypothetical protein